LGGGPFFLLDSLEWSTSLDTWRRTDLPLRILLVCSLLSIKLGMALLLLASSPLLAHLKLVHAFRDGRELIHQVGQALAPCRLWLRLLALPALEGEPLVPLAFLERCLAPLLRVLVRRRALGVFDCIVAAVAARAERLQILWQLVGRNLRDDERA
jgi:hypothetical protein